MWVLLGVGAIIFALIGIIWICRKNQQSGLAL